MSNKLQRVYQLTRQVFNANVGLYDRGLYSRDKDWSFSLNADRIIETKIPIKAAGCTSACKVFCKFARDIGLDCFVVCAADVQGLHENNKTIHGHQFIAVDINGGLYGIDILQDEPVPLFFIKKPGVGEKYKFDGRDHIVTAIIERDDIEKIDSYQKLRNLYVNGKI